MHKRFKRPIIILLQITQITVNRYLIILKELEIHKHTKIDPSELLNEKPMSSQTHILSSIFSYCLPSAYVYILIFMNVMYSCYILQEILMFDDGWK